LTSPADKSPQPLTLRQMLILAAVMFAAAVAVAAACSFIGVAELSWDGWLRRLNRLAAAGLVGIALAAAGMGLQGLLRNPLAEPYILGISTGAGVGVLVGWILVARYAFAAWGTTPVLALVGAMATAGIVYAIAQRRGRLDPYALLLSGVIVNVFNGAIMLTILLFLSRNQLMNYIGWSMGRIPDEVKPELLAVCGACIAAGWAVLLARGAAFNMLGLGDDVAASSGVGVHRLRVETFLVVSLMTSAAVALAGPVGFLGLIVPHVCRLLVGADHRRLVIVSGLAGAIFLMIADTFCRTIGWYLDIGEVPVGVVTALAGGPFFIFLLRRRFKEKAR
jgi:iron complex transport system permease protein